MRSRTNGFSHSRRFYARRTILPIIFVLLIVSIAFFLILQGTNALIPDDTTTELATLWEEQNYQEIGELTTNFLKETPLNSNYLFYNGISNFYHALTLVNHDEQQERLDGALYSLRKLLYASPIGYTNRIQYIIGKIYFHKGPFYYDLAEKYLSLVDQSAFKAADIVEYLGVIYLDTERQQAGIEYLLRAIVDNPSDLLYYTVATAYEDLGDYKNSLEYYQFCLLLTKDKILTQKSLIGQGRVFFAMNDLEQAKQILQQVLSDNTQAAEAYFYLGEIYALEEDLVKARANWRKAYNQNKTFIPALERLNS